MKKYCSNTCPSYPKGDCVNMSMGSGMMLNMNNCTITNFNVTMNMPEEAVTCFNVSLITTINGNSVYLNAPNNDFCFYTPVPSSGVAAQWILNMPLSEGGPICKLGTGGLCIGNQGNFLVLDADTGNSNFSFIKSGDLYILSSFIIQDDTAITTYVTSQVVNGSLYATFTRDRSQALAFQVLSDGSMPYNC